MSQPPLTTRSSIPNFESVLGVPGQPLLFRSQKSVEIIPEVEAGFQSPCSSPQLVKQEYIMQNMQSILCKFKLSNVTQFEYQMHTLHCPSTECYFLCVESVHTSKPPKSSSSIFQEIPRKQHKILTDKE